jgi:lipid II:glycine glycyltransferase (peptidoglycan interpeptide bridge formation enzyme)
LNKTEEELLKEMHSKTRYNINLAKKKGVIVKFEKNIDLYWQLNKDTSERNKITSHSKNYLEKLLSYDNIYQLNTYLGNIVLSSTILLKYENTMYYLFGASSNKYRNFMAPYLNQWAAIKFAKEKFCSTYDFWGIAAKVSKENKDALSHHHYYWDKNDPLSGVTKFKSGFNGKLKKYPQAVEIILNSSKYKLFSFLQKLRKKF